MADIERHVDGCARCSDLAAEFGRLYAETVQEPPPIERRFAPLALALAALIHVGWTLLLSSVAAVVRDVLPAWLAGAYLKYATFWAPVGCGVALGAAFGLVGGQRWGRLLAIVHGVLSLPSIVLTPLALFVLDSLRRGRSR
jgi:hypothetical protein